MIKLGNQKVDLCKGSTLIKKAYRGSSLIYDRADYIPLEYLESDGNQYLLTDYYPNPNTAVEIDYYPNPSTVFTNIYGVQDSASSNRFYGLISSVNYKLQINTSAGSDTYYGLSGGGDLMKTNVAYTSSQIRIALKVDNFNKLIRTTEIDNGKTVNYDMNQFGELGSPNCNYPLVIFNRSTAGKITLTNGFKGRIYSFKIWEKEKIVHYYIPVLDKNFIPCMYDKVSGKYFYNKGIGEFKWKLPNQLDYLEATGEQWIDTGLFGNQDTEIQTQFEISKPSQRVYGSYETNKNITAYESTDGGNHRFGDKTALIKSPLNKPITIIHNKNGITYNGTLYSYENVNDFETNSTIYVGDINGFTSGNRFIGKMYYFKILQNGKVVQYLIPAFDDNLNICMYDLVSKKYFENKGTGKFIGG